MSVLIFIVILLVLVVGHEFGHFVAARIFGMRVPEFGVGFPPRLWGVKIGETEYTVNAFPIGGFVKIHGEDASGVDAGDASAFPNRPVYAQAATLVAGPLMNILIAFLLSSLAFMVGIPAATGGAYPTEDIQNVRVLVTEVLPGSPAEKAGIDGGDMVTAVSVNGVEHAVAHPVDISPLVQEAQGPIELSLVRGGKNISLAVTPEKGIVPGAPGTQAIGIAAAMVGTLRLPFFAALEAGFQETLQNISGVATGIASLIAHAATFSANLSGIAGPVGIASLVGTAAAFGLGSVLSFAALISVNLGVINLFPFPALDGGRLALLLVESVSRRKVPPRFSDALNAIGFVLLIALVVFITVHDVFRLVG